jgi:DNA repair exonuclease SbcCD ATPase subunit
MEFTQENFDKLLKTAEEIENYKKAVKEERERRKQSQDELDSVKSSLSELETFKKELEEKEAKKKGKYEELLAEREKQVQELTEQKASIEAKALKYDEFLNKSLEEKIGKIPEEKQEFVKKVIGDKDHEAQLELLDGFIADYSTQNKDFKAKPADDGIAPKDTSKLDEAKANKDIVGMITNAPVIE